MYENVLSICLLKTEQTFKVIEMPFVGSIYSVYFYLVLYSEEIRTYSRREIERE